MWFLVILACHFCFYIFDIFTICDAFQMVVVLCQVSNPCSTNSQEPVKKVRFAWLAKQEDGWWARCSWKLVFSLIAYNFLKIHPKSGHGIQLDIKECTLTWVIICIPLSCLHGYLPTTVTPPPLPLCTMCKSNNHRSFEWMGIEFPKCSN